MRVSKVINNNVISVINEQNKELVIMGRGIGFQVKSGDLVDKSKIEKIFTLNNKEISERFKTLLVEVPIEVMEVTEKIVKIAKVNFKKELNDIIYVSLADHINFAIERHQKGIDIKNGLLWETKKLYKDEYFVGKEALKLIEETFKVTLPEDEAGFIALHILNAEMNEEVRDMKTITKIIQQTLNIVKYHFKTDFDEESLNYFRFVTHLKFFGQRLLNKSYLDSEDDFLFEMVKEKHKDIFVCTQKINDYIKKEYEYELTSEEKLYLTIHINRVINR